MAQRRRDDLLRIRVHRPPSVVFRSDAYLPPLNRWPDIDTGR